jgi:hypothetical protein
MAQAMPLKQIAPKLAVTAALLLQACPENACPVGKDKKLAICDGPGLPVALEASFSFRVRQPGQFFDSNITSITIEPPGALNIITGANPVELRAKQIGTATISVTADGRSDRFFVSVREPAKQQLSVETLGSIFFFDGVEVDQLPPVALLADGDLVARARVFDAGGQELGGDLDRWSTSSPSIVLTPSGDDGRRVTIASTATDGVDRVRYGDRTFTFGVERQGRAASLGAFDGMMRRIDDGMGKIDLGQLDGFIFVAIDDEGRALIGSYPGAQVLQSSGPDWGFRTVGEGGPITVFFDAFDKATKPAPGTVALDVTELEVTQHFLVVSP